MCGHARPAARPCCQLRADTPAQLRALAAVLAARGFACMAGGELIIFLAKNDDMVEGEVIKMPRSLGNGVHGLESLQPARWGRFRRFGLDQKVPTTTELVEAVKKERAKNAAKGGVCAQPNPSPIWVPNLSSHSPLVCISLCVPSQARSSRRPAPTSRAAQRRSARRPSSRRWLTAVRAPSPTPAPPKSPISLTCKCVRLARCAFAGKKIKEAHAKVKSGTATEIEVTIVKKMDKGTHPGYVVLDENGDMRNA
jgi:hypothetical protein